MAAKRSPRGRKPYTMWVVVGKTLGVYGERPSFRTMSHTRKSATAWLESFGCVHDDVVKFVEAMPRKRKARRKTK